MQSWIEEAYIVVSIDIWEFPPLGYPGISQDIPRYPKISIHHESLGNPLWISKDISWICLDIFWGTYRISLGHPLISLLYPYTYPGHLVFILSSPIYPSLSYDIIRYPLRYP
jgi:hypothetical protein